MNFLDYIKKHVFYLIVCIIVIVVSGFSLLLLPIKNAITVESQEITLLGISLGNWGIWISIVGALFASVWAMYQYTKNASLKQQEKASEIAKAFSDDLLKKCSTVNTVYQNSILNSFIEDIRKSKTPLIDFNTDELREITNNDDFPSRYKELKSSIDFDYLYFRVLEKRITTNLEYREKYRSIDHSADSSYSYSTEDARKLFILDNQNYPFHFSALVNEVLNKLEYICIGLSTHAAGSTYIYQSLHQIFFETVETLYFEICNTNNGKYSDKFYTNIIHVYKEWQKIREKSLQSETKKKLKKKKTLNPKIRTVE